MQSLNPEFLKTFVKAYEVKNFTKTASLLGMTQPGVSQHILEVEESLGIKLFQRIGKTVVPTNEARRVYEFAVGWLDEISQFITSSNKGIDYVGGDLKLSLLGSFGAHYLPHLIRLQKNYPELCIDVEYGPNYIIYDRLLAGSTDIGVVSEVQPSKYLVVEQFSTEEYVLVTCKKNQLRLKDFDSKKVPFVDYVGSEPIFNQWFAKNFPEDPNVYGRIDVRAKINNMEAIFQLVLEGVGATIFPKRALMKWIKSRELKVVKGKSLVTHPLYIVQRKKISSTKKEQILIEQIKSSVR